MQSTTLSAVCPGNESGRSGAAGSGHHLAAAWSIRAGLVTEIENKR